MPSLAQNPLSTHIHQIVDSLGSLTAHVLSRCTSGRYWLTKSTMLSVLLCFFFSGPPPIFNERTSIYSWEIYSLKIASPFTDITPHVDDLGKHEAKLNYRLTVPVIANLLQLNRTAIVGLAIALGIASFALIIAAASTATSSRILGITTDLLTATLPSGYLPFYAGNGLLFDGYALFFLAWGCAARRPWELALAVFLASWTDERALLASCLVWAFHAAKSPDQPGPKVRTMVIACTSAWVVYFASRYGIWSAFHLPTNAAGTGLACLKRNAYLFQWCLWNSLKFAWCPLIFIGVQAIRLKKELAFSALLIGGTGIVLGASLLVDDLTKSMAYVLPALPLMSLLLARHLGSERAAGIMLVITPFPPCCQTTISSEPPPPSFILPGAPLGSWPLCLNSLYFSKQYFNASCSLRCSGNSDI